MHVQKPKINLAVALAEFRLMLHRKATRKEKVRRRVLGAVDFGTELEKFLKWEVEYERFRYEHRNEESCSLIFEALMEIMELGESQELTGDFMAENYLYKGYNFQLFLGQGAFWRILKNGEQIFQST